MWYLVATDVNHAVILAQDSVAAAFVDNFENISSWTVVVEVSLYIFIEYCPNVFLFVKISTCLGRCANIGHVRW